MQCNCRFKQYIFIVLLVMLPSSVLFAKSEVGVIVGQYSKFVPVQKTDLEDGGQALSVCYHTKTTYLWFVSLWMSDAGLVLCSDTSYRELPTGDELARLQSMGLLPRSWPPYAIPLLDFINGFQLWLFIGVLFGIFMVRRWTRRLTVNDPAVTAAAVFEAMTKALETTANNNTDTTPCEEQGGTTEAEVLRKIYKQMTGAELCKSCDDQTEDADMSVSDFGLSSDEQNVVAELLQKRFVELKQVNDDND